MTTVGTTYALFTLNFWKQTITMAVHGAATGALSSVGVHTATDELRSLPWELMGSFALSGAVLAILANISAIALPWLKPAGFAASAPLPADVLAVSKMGATVIETPTPTVAVQQQPAEVKESPQREAP